MNPRDGPRDDRAVAAHERSEPAPAKPATVLVVEDEILIRMAAAEHLRESGLRALEAASAEEAQALLRAEESVSLLFTDINLPGQNGAALARWVANLYPEVKVVLTSGEPARLREASDLGLLLEKPYTLESLSEVIERLLAQ